MSARECLFVLALGVGVLSACSGSKERVCNPGVVQHCPCLSGAQGVQTCADDGARWDACVCPDGGSAADGGVDAPVDDGGAGSDGAVDAGSDACGAGATTVTVAQIAQGQIAAGTVVQLTGVVATSQQFLNAKSSLDDSCQWGLFVSAPFDRHGGGLQRPLRGRLRLPRRRCPTAGLAPTAPSSACRRRARRSPMRRSPATCSRWQARWRATSPPRAAARNPTSRRCRSGA